MMCGVFYGALMIRWRGEMQMNGASLKCPSGEGRVTVYRAAAVSVLGSVNVAGAAIRRFCVCDRGPETESKLGY